MTTNRTSGPPTKDGIWWVWLALSRGEGVALETRIGGKVVTRQHPTEPSVGYDTGLQVVAHREYRSGEEVPEVEVVPELPDRASWHDVDAGVCVGGEGDGSSHVIVYPEIMLDSACRMWKWSRIDAARRALCQRKGQPDPFGEVELPPLPDGWERLPDDDHGPVFRHEVEGNRVEYHKATNGMVGLYVSYMGDEVTTPMPAILHALQAAGKLPRTKSGNDDFAAKVRHNFGNLGMSDADILRDLGKYREFWADHRGESQVIPGQCLTTEGAEHYRWSEDHPGPVMVADVVGREAWIFVVADGVYFQRRDGMGCPVGLPVGDKWEAIDKARSAACAAKGLPDPFGGAEPSQFEVPRAFSDGIQHVAISHDTVGELDFDAVGEDAVAPEGYSWSQDSHGLRLIDGDGGEEVGMYGDDLVVDYAAPRLAVAYLARLGLCVPIKSTTKVETP